MILGSTYRATRSGLVRSKFHGVPSAIRFEMVPKCKEHTIMPQCNETTCHEITVKSMVRASAKNGGIVVRYLGKEPCDHGPSRIHETRADRLKRMIWTHFLHKTQMDT